MKSVYSINNQDKDTKKNQTKIRILFILITLTLLQQMPVVKDLYYNQIRWLLYVLFGVYSIISFFKITKYLKYRMIKLFIFTIIYSLFLFIVTKMTGSEASNSFELIIPFGILLCSLNTEFNNKQLSKLIIWYVIIAALVGVSSIFYYGSGFTITDTYFLEGKNQIGPILGISAIIVLIWIGNNNQIETKYNHLILKILVITLIISSIVIIRNRASLLGILLTFTLIMSKEYKFKSTIRNFLIAQFIVIVLVTLFIFGAFNSLIDAVFKSLFLNFDIYNLNSLSAGRLGVYKLSLLFMLRHPILGELGTGKFMYSIPHNYILNKWVSFGIVGSLPIVLFYLYLWFYTLKKIFTVKGNRKYSFPLWVLLFSLIVSIFEYTYPYGPGVSQVMVWFLMGQYLLNIY